jgi:hypothetical protein
MYPEKNNNKKKARKFFLPHGEKVPNKTKTMYREIKQFQTMLFYVQATFKSF